MTTPRLSCRCSPHLLAQAHQRAAREGTPLSVALRSLVKDYVHGRNPTVHVARAFETLAAELRPIGVNLNQAARSLNSGIYPDDLAGCVAELAAKVEQVAANVEAYALPRQP